MSSVDWLMCFFFCGIKFWSIAMTRKLASCQCEKSVTKLTKWLTRIRRKSVSTPVNFMLVRSAFMTGISRVRLCATITKASAFSVHFPRLYLFLWVRDFIRVFHFLRSIHNGVYHFSGTERQPTEGCQVPSWLTVGGFEPETLRFKPHDFVRLRAVSLVPKATIRVEGFMIWTDHL